MSSAEEFTPPDLSVADFEGLVRVRESRGCPEGLTIKQAIVAIRCLEDATDRWQRLEGGRSRTAPLWLDETEARKLLDMLRGQKSVEARLIRQALQELFP